MANEFQVFDSINLAGGQYLISATISGSEQYWTGTAWTATFGSGHLYSTGSITKLGATVYTGTLNGALPDDADDGILWATFWDSSTTPSLPGQANADYSTSSGLSTNQVSALIQASLAGSRLSVQSPVAKDQSIEIIKGDDYSVSDGSAIQWSIANYGGPTVDSVTVSLIPTGDYNAGNRTGTSIGSASASMADTTLVTSLELTSVQSAALDNSDPPSTPYNYIYQVQLISSSKVHSKFLGAATVRESVI